MANEKRAVEIGPTGERVAENLTRLRKIRQLSQQDLAERVTALGRELRMSSVSKMEKRQRRVDVDDLVALALALDVHPTALLLPSRVVDDVRLTEDKTVPGYLARGWMDGYNPLVLPKDDPDGAALVDFRAVAVPPGWSARLNVGLNRGMDKRMEAFTDSGEGDANDRL